MRQAGGRREVRGRGGRRRRERGAEMNEKEMNEKESGGIGVREAVLAYVGLY